MEMKGKRCVVTGSTKGIGLAVARALAAAGGDVVVSARNAEEVERTVGDLKGAGDGRVIGIPCDVRRHDDVRALIGGAVDFFGGLDVVVNNAGIGGFAPVDEIDPQTWRAIIDTNLTGVFYCCHEAIPHLRRAGGGWIVNVGSLAGRNAFAGGAAYNASKFGLLGFSEALMLDVRFDGIRVTCVMPGTVDTHFMDKTPGEENAWMLQPEDVAEVVLDLVRFHPRALPSRVEIRPTAPRKS